jgi:ribosomal protein S18 acetylase RimI-like enzyme
MQIRPASRSDDGDSIWVILEPTIRAAETYTLSAGMPRDEALAYWFGPQHEVYAATEGDQVLGTYFLQPNQQGGGSHVANCGYVTASWAMGRGVGRAMCAHSLDRARERGFRAMQFNFVVTTNKPAVHLWRSFGFEIVGRLPGAFRHPSQGFVDALVMYRSLL